LLYFQAKNQPLQQMKPAEAQAIVSEEKKTQHEQMKPEAAPKPEAQKHAEINMTPTSSPQRSRSQPNLNAGTSNNNKMPLRKQLLYQAIIGGAMESQVNVSI
jgi:ribonuclease PH